MERGEVKDFMTTVLKPYWFKKKHDDGDGCIKKCSKLRDVIYGRPPSMQKLIADKFLFFQRETRKTTTRQQQETLPGFFFLLLAFSRSFLVHKAWVGEVPMAVRFLFLAKFLRFCIIFKVCSISSFFLLTHSKIWRKISVFLKTLCFIKWFCIESFISSISYTPCKPIKDVY